MLKKRLRVIISGGGTGGHIFPAIAIANELKRQYPDVLIHFVGAKGKMEMEKVPKAGYPITGLWISGIQRSQLWKNWSFPFKVISSLINARKIIKKIKPDIAIGVGGFASGPLLYAASKMKVPTLIQEQNNYPGITNKLLARTVDCVCTGFPGLERFFPNVKMVVTGNPIRTDLLQPTSKEAARKSFGLEENRPTVLVVGGSLGARSINDGIEKGLKDLDADGLQMIWQTGKSYHGNANPKHGIRKVFIEDMRQAYASADLVVSRAGALSIAELSALGKASILIPLPTATEDHQTANAMGLVKAGGAELVKDKEISNELTNSILMLLKNQTKRQQMEKAALSAGMPKAAESIVAEIVKLVEK
jgi:UDP-N-acetylglucosamine--N-acetylmuramyl-(pentapeptide) pyrophosphoryl-undecaprenol N-acetylglucosamine transferase